MKLLKPSKLLQTLLKRVSVYLRVSGQVVALLHYLKKLVQFLFAQMKLKVKIQIVHLV
ncbi:Uncharacterised protein [Acinetobacter baumannii]|nr:Uncharacterised protein [Acinetobacter baumannii]